MILGRQLFTGALAERLFEETAGLLAARTGEAVGLNGGLTGRRDDDFDDLKCGGLQAAPPATWIVSLTEPSANGCSRTVCPCLRASSAAFSQA